MTADPGDHVTARVVDDLWIEAIEGSASPDRIHIRVEALLDRVSAESPVVNWGMTDLHALTRAGRASVDELIAARRTWLAKIKEYEADPET